MLFWPAMDYGYQQTANALFGRFKRGPQLRLSLVIAPWALLLLFYFLRRLGKQGEMVGQISGVVLAAVAVLRYEQLNDWVRAPVRDRRRPVDPGRADRAGRSAAWSRFSGCGAQQIRLEPPAVDGVGLSQSVVTATVTAHGRRLQFELEDGAIGPRQRVGESRMLTVYDAADGVLVARESADSVNGGTVWIDLLNPPRRRTSWWSRRLASPFRRARRWPRSRRRAASIRRAARTT